MSALTTQDEMQTIVERALGTAKKAGATQADCLIVEGDDREVRVRGDEIEFVKQAQGRGLGIRAMVQGKGGLQSAIVSTSDLAPDAVDRMAQEAVALAQATAPDPTAGLPEGGFATEIPDLELLDASDRGVPLEARIEDAKRAEAAARNADPRIDNSEGSQASSGFGRVVYGNSAGFIGKPLTYIIAFFFNFLTDSLRGFIHHRHSLFTFRDYGLFLARRRHIGRHNCFFNFGRATMRTLYKTLLTLSVII